MDTIKRTVTGSTPEYIDRIRTPKDLLVEFEPYTEEDIDSRDVLVFGWLMKAVCAGVAIGIAGITMIILWGALR